MRLLVVINRFPPHHGGGYGLRIGDIVADLGRRGHRTAVVTSTRGVTGPVVEEGGIHRVLTLHDEIHGPLDIANLARATWSDALRLRAAVRRERPDVILVGNFFGLSSGLWTTLHDSGIPLVLDVSNEWLLDLAVSHGNWFRIWEKPSRTLSGVVIKSVARCVLDLASRGVLRSRFPGLGGARIYATARHLVDTLDRAGVSPEVRPTVCASGIEIEKFPFEPSMRPLTKLLYVGRLKSIKGVHTALEAMCLLPGEATLTIVGLEDDETYGARLRERAREAPLTGRVAFREPVPHDRLASIFHGHDALIFPSECDEAFSRLVLEAMSCGLPVIATPNGGTAEAVRDGENGLLFPAGSADALAARVVRLAANPDLRRAIIHQGRRDVERDYEQNAAVTRIERLLVATARTSGRESAA